MLILQGELNREAEHRDRMAPRRVGIGSRTVADVACAANRGGHSS